MIRIRLWAVFALTIGLFTSASPTSAHGYLVRAIPENRAVLERAPTRVQYWFSEGLEAQFSSIHVRDQMGNIIASGGLSETDNTLLTARLPNDLPDGAYVVELRPAFASDGHVYAESRVFFIGEAIGGVDAQANTTAIALEVVWRFITISASMILFGAMGLYAWVLIPAWGNKNHRAGWLPPRLMKRLHILIGMSLLVAFLGNGLALIQQTMVFFNIRFDQALQPQFWDVVRVGSRFGDVWMWRMGLMSLLGMMFLATLNYQGRYPEVVYPFWIAGLWIGALILGTFSITSHVAGALTMAWVGIFVDWAHRLAVAMWVGGLFALMICLNIALQPYADDQRMTALRVVIKRFSGVAIGALAVTIASGIYSASNWIYGVDEIQSRFGGTLIAKIILIAPLLIIGGVNHLLAHPEQYAQLRHWINPRITHFIHITRLEVLLASAVVISASTLSATPIPKPSFIQTDVTSPSATQQVKDMTVSMSISPGGTGVNTFDITLMRDDMPITDATVRLLNQSPIQDRRGERHIAEAIDDGLYVSAGGEINQGGTWWSLVDVTVGDQTQRIAFAWDINPDAGVIISLPPTPIQLLALAIVMGAVIFALSPIIRSRIHKMGLNTFSVSAGIAAVILTAIALVVGWRVMESTQQQYLATLNPPPMVVNTHLPTAESLSHGKMIFDSACAVWENHRQFRDLLERLNRTRDEALYAALTDGWRDLPACGRELSPDDRWHVVNYIRSLSL
jgi:putative copper export protein/methionine-rich copper-binding protein CopC